MKSIDLGIWLLCISRLWVWIPIVVVLSTAPRLRFQGKIVWAYMEFIWPRILLTWLSTTCNTCIMQVVMVILSATSHSESLWTICHYVMMTTTICGMSKWLSEAVKSLLLSFGFNGMVRIWWSRKCTVSCGLWISVTFWQLWRVHYLYKSLRFVSAHLILWHTPLKIMRLKKGHNWNFPFDYN